MYDNESTTHFSPQCWLITRFITTNDPNHVQLCAVTNVKYSLHIFCVEGSEHYDVVVPNSTCLSENNMDIPVSSPVTIVPPKIHITETGIVHIPDLDSAAIPTNAALSYSINHGTVFGSYKLQVQRSPQTNCPPSCQGFP